MRKCDLLCILGAVVTVQVLVARHIFRQLKLENALTIPASIDET